MIITQEIIQTITKHLGFTCDKCKKSFIKNDGKHTFDYRNYAELEFSPGYGSHYDGDLWQLDLCEDCWWIVFEFITGEPKPEPNSKSGYLKKFSFSMPDDVLLDDVFNDD